MVEFRIGRGHDGPARLGEYLVGSTTYTTPLLTGAIGKQDNYLKYGTFGRSSIQDSMLLSMPNTLELDDKILLETNDSHALILPSMISFDSLESNAGTLMLQHQLETFRMIKSHIDPSCFVVRIPEDVEHSSFHQIITDFHNDGVRAAAFSFDGLLGSTDFNSMKLRSRLPTSWITIALGRIAPSTLPLLFYLGFDIFDTGHADEAAVKGLRLWYNGSEEVSSTKQNRFCPCSSCASIEGATDASLVDILRNHNLNTYTSMLSESIDAMNAGKLRWLIESMTHTSPSHASIVRLVDKYIYDYIEEFTPSAGAKVIPLIGPESYNAPAVRRYRQYLTSRYQPLPHKPIILLLPCSAKKPYSDSKSHKRFLTTVEDALGSTSGSLAQVILTSPLGVVPRELERIFPAANYDIPVTGDWDYEETSIAADTLVQHLTKFPSSSTVVAHVSGGYLGIVKAAEERIEQSIIYTTPEFSPTSRESLVALHETLTDLKSILELKTTPPSALEEIVSATADFQFGRGAGELLVPENAKLGGKPYRQIICRIGKEQVCSFIADVGLLSLTLHGAKRLIELERYWVRLDAPAVRGGSIFAVGVSEADPSIRPGDEVIVLNENGDLTAVGRSEMSGREMCELSRGRAVTVRHKLEGDN